MKLVAPHDRPREKLARAGVSALGDNELIAVLLGTGTRNRNALAVAHDVLELSGGVSGLPQLGMDELLRVSGVGRPRAARVLAAVELGRRAMSHVGPQRPRLASSTSLGRYLLALYGGHREERFGILMLDSKYRLIRSETLSIGTLDASFAHPRDIFRTAALASAFCIALFHNHPSGDPSPSREDAELTTRVVAAGDIMGIDVIDHVILGAGRWFSFRDAGLLR
jgi:DNA repair protein RadC